MIVIKNADWANGFFVNPTSLENGGLRYRSSTLQYAKALNLGSWKEIIIQSCWSFCPPSVGW
ncbi:MAG: hypothetical protein L3J59_09765 [Methylococcaceae bacterium]|nr:hypothetical protein [Methylococcaceae bacterium]